jgi:hypothetical protein
MTAAVGPVKARFAGKLTLSDVDPPHAYSLAFEGSGGAAGFGKGSSRVRLMAEDAGTRLTYTATATVGGKLAQVGSRLIDGVARKMTDDFFARFDRTLQPPQVAAAAAAAPGRGIPHWAWVSAALIAAVILSLWALRAT